jgi:hypothetical protein
MGIRLESLTRPDGSLRELLVVAFIGAAINYLSFSQPFFEDGVCSFNKLRNQFCAVIFFVNEFWVKIL